MRFERRSVTKPHIPPIVIFSTWHLLLLSERRAPQQEASVDCARCALWLADQPMYIAFDALLDRQKRGAVASAAQPGQIRLRKALVFAAQRIRKGDIFDFPLRYQRFKRIRHCVSSIDDAHRNIIKWL